MADRTLALAYLTSDPSASHFASPLHKPGQWKQARKNNLPLETASWWQGCPGSQEQGCFTRSAPPVAPWKEPCETRPTGASKVTPSLLDSAPDYIASVRRLHGWGAPSVLSWVPMMCKTLLSVVEDLKHRQRKLPLSSYQCGKKGTITWNLK